MKHNLKKLLPVLILALALQEANSQTKPDGSAPQFLYPEFVKGEIRLKNGKSQFALLNYNTVSEQVVFRQDEKIFDLINVENIDTVYIFKSKFIPSASRFYYELLLPGKVPLFLQHKGTLLPPGKPGAYGTTSQVSSSTYLSSTQLQSGYYNLKLPEDYDVKVDPVFWVRKDTIMASFISEKQFLKIFPGSADDLKRYIKQDRIRFDRVQDVIRLLTWMNLQNKF
ncbi:MAG TPA: hypothetical protein VK155_18690 [Bacteroidales bacterium]|nr:hypothetical protein [Bacteroidales bacterium]